MKPRKNANKSITILPSRVAIMKPCVQTQLSAHRVNSQSLLTLETILRTLSSHMSFYTKHFQVYQYILGYFMSSTKAKIT